MEEIGVRGTEEEEELKKLNEEIVVKYGLEQSKQAEEV